MNQLDVAEVVGVIQAQRHLARDVGGHIDGNATPFLAQRFQMARRSRPSTNSMPR